MRVEVVYIDATLERIKFVELASGANVQDAVIASGLMAEFKHLSLHEIQVGIFGKRTTLCAPVTSGDRVEIYRPLKMSPLEARRRRAENSPLIK